MNRFIRGPLNIHDFIKFHNANHVKYCEVVIHKNGDIEYCIPSHQETLIRLSGYTKKELEEKISIFDDVEISLCNMTGCISVRYNMYTSPKNITNEQYESLMLLKNNNCISFRLLINKEPGYHLALNERGELEL